MPEETWLQMLFIVGMVLVGCSVPLLVITLVRRLHGNEIRSMWIKYGSWFIIFPVFTLPIFIDPRAMQALFLVMSLVAFEEYARAVGLWKEPAHMWLGRICIVLVYVAVYFKSFGLFMSVPAYVVVLIFLLPIFRDKYRGMIQRTCLTMLGVLYFGWFLAHLAYLLNIDTGRQLILAFMLIVVVNDAAAYIIGSNLGRHRMSPNISPNKTWEGAIGATLIAIGTTIGVRFALYDMSIGVAVLLGFLLAFGGTCGDLAMSVIKRDVQIKDTGSLIPGHGGLLDRLDSVLFVAPIFFHFMNAFYIAEINL